MLEFFAVRDDKVGIFTTPFQARSMVDAIRNLSVVVQDPKSNLSRFPEDFTLYRVASFDDATGVFSEMKPEMLTSIQNLKNQGEKTP